MQSVEKIITSNLSWFILCFLPRPLFLGIQCSMLAFPTTALKPKQQNRELLFPETPEATFEGHRLKCTKENFFLLGQK